MKWALHNDDTTPVITPEKHIKSAHGHRNICNLPEICVMFEIGIAMQYVENNFETVTLAETLPCFLDNPKCISVKSNPNVCFTRGGYGAPAAVDTLETVRALGIRRIIVVGMCGVFADGVGVGDVIIPGKVLCEEGTTHHYIEPSEFILPDNGLSKMAETYYRERFTVKTDATVTSDAIYRQTFAKEALWRSKGCIGVDMESSALLSVSQYYSIPAVTILLASDKHPLNETDKSWQWGNDNFNVIKRDFIRQSVLFSLGL